MRVTFKREPKPTGLWVVSNPYPVTAIKVDGKRVGSINPPNNKISDWGIAVAIKKNEKFNDKNPNRDWMWIHVTKRFRNENEARAFIKDNMQRITASLVLHYFDE